MARDHWQDGSAYEGYVGRWSRRVAERFVPWVDVARGGVWVDVGCGTGVLTRTIIELAGPASVVGVDPSAGFLRTARSSVRDSRVEFVEGSGGANTQGLFLFRNRGDVEQADGQRCARRRQPRADSHGRTLAP